MSSDSVHKLRFDPLRVGNYPQWRNNALALLMTKGWAQLVLGKQKRPTPAVAGTPKPEEQVLMDAWDEKAMKAAGELFLTLSEDQKTHVSTILDDPVAMWTKLETVHLQKKPGMRFNAWEEFFSIHLEENESLSSLMTRIDAAMQKVKNLRPDSYSLTALDDELVAMTMIRALPSSYSSFASSLQLLDKLDKDKLQAAFINEEALRTRSSTPGTSAVLSAFASQPSSSLVCDFCSLPGHAQATCIRYLRSKDEASKDAQEKRKQRGKNNKNKAKSTPAAAAAQETEPEFAGQASVRAPSTSTTPEDTTHLLWTADTGATSHMTPHKHWLRNYTPLRVPVRLANNQIVYSEGVGSVVFAPEVKGECVRKVEFSRVLHVPALGSNLFSVLYLTRQRGFIVHIYSERMNFDHSGHTLFCAAINTSNTAYLTGQVVPAFDSALAASSSTLPLDESLWHRRFAHVHMERIRDLLKGDMVKGIKLESQQRADPICEPCLAGKLNAAPFLPSQNRAPRVLYLIHPDVHGPLPVRTPSGYCYWVTFLDDKPILKAVLLLKSKGEADAAFRQFKAWAENETKERICILRDDKGGEYMSKSLEDFCSASGIERQHSVRNRPQQNGVAERFNRVLAEGITAMLSEAGLPPTFWGEALSALVHVLNRSPTSTLPGQTPYEAFYGRKPDVSHLRIWGSLAYVHVQKDKRGQLGSHMEKCIFIGYPKGYKGWKFYNPSTKKAIISERAIFDERYFHGPKNWSSVPSLPTNPPQQPSSTAPTDFVEVELSDPSEDVQQPRLGGERHGGAQVEPAVPPPAEQPRAPSPGAQEPPAPPSRPQSPLPPAPEQPAVQPARQPVQRAPASGRQQPPRTRSESRRGTPSASQTRSRSAARSESQPGPSGARSESPERSLAERRPRRNVRPPGEWWKVQPSGQPSAPIQPASVQDPISEAENEDEEPDADAEAEGDVALSEASTDELCMKASAQNSWPGNWSQAMSRSDAEEWRHAAQAEIEAHIANGTWEPCQLPPGKKAIGSRWVFTQKFLSNGELERYKARLVVKGCAQRPGFDYLETFAPTVCMATLRVVLALAAMEDLDLRALDISNAFINGLLEEEVYIQQPEGFHFGNPGDILRLRKALYGLKQAPRVWNKTLHQTLQKLGFARLKSDASLYLYRRGTVRIIMPVFIDDITLASSSAEESDRLVQELSQHFKLRDLGPTSWLLGILITRDRPNRCISLSQRISSRA